MAAKDSEYNGLRRAVAFCRAMRREPPKLAIVLGSSFGDVCGAMDGEWVDASRIPGCPVPGIPGHQGRWGWGNLGRTPVLLVAGRTHFYERRSMAAATFAVRLMAAYGIADILLTNAAGCLVPRWTCGDLMIVRDHINFMGVNPLCEMGWKRAEDFVDMSQAYDATLRKWLRAAGKEAGLTLREGTYVAVSGPSYETPAEIGMFRKWGAHAVGMSTVPEVIVARRHGLRVAALSCLTNMAAGLSAEGISHDEVVTMGKKRSAQNSELIRIFAQKFARVEKDG